MVSAEGGASCCIWLTPAGPTSVSTQTLSLIGSNEDVKRLLASWQTDGNAEEALKVLKNDTSCVGQLLHGLKKHGAFQAMCPFWLIFC